MFKYQSMFRSQASGQAFKIIFLCILSGIFMTVAAGIIFGIFGLPVFGFYDSFWVVLYILFGMFLFFILSILVLYPMSIGMFRFFTSAYKKEPFGFGELFFAFKNGRYGKAVKLVVIVVVFYFVFSMIIGFIGNMLYMLVNAPLSAVGLFINPNGSFDADWSSITAQAGIVIVVLLLNFLVSIIMFIPYLLVSLYIGLIYLAFVDEPLIPTLDKFKVAWDVMFKSGESIWRLFISNVLFIAGIGILYFVIILGALLIGLVADSPGMFVFFGILGSILLLILYIYVGYIIVGSVVAFYFMGRETLDVRAQEEGLVQEDSHLSENDAFSEDPDDLKPL